VGVPAQSCAPGVRAVIESAWIEQRPVVIRYDGARGESERTVRVRAVVMERTETLLNCDDLEKGEARQFKLHRITAARLPTAATGEQAS
jgi:predicted DNA-binding transcriptional regulator YafY